MFYKKQASEEYRRAQKKIDFQKTGSIILIVVSYHFVGFPVACLAGLTVVIFALSEIEKLLNYSNFMKEKEIGLHDLMDDK